jgi:hypothetical protein
MDDYCYCGSGNISQGNDEIKVKKESEKRLARILIDEIKQTKKRTKEGR